MHEVSVVRSILDTVEENARRHEVTKVTRVKMSVGSMTCIDIENLKFIFDVMKKDTLASGAKLEVESLPLQVTCGECDAVSPVKEYRFICASCGSRKVRISQGNELIVQSLEAE